MSDQDMMSQDHMRKGMMMEMQNMRMGMTPSEDTK
jgi:hypothetical protein